MALYTADEMRKMASSVLNECEDSEHGLLYPSRYLSGHLFYPEDAAKMLRQAADAMEREKRYEYSRAFYDGTVSAVRVDDIKVAKLMSKFGPYIVRREVGEWEEVANDNN